MTAAKPHKGHYSELEAANALGLSTDELRRLIRHHIVRGEDELPSLSQASFQPSDVLLLRILAGQPTGSC
jgi:hypothetical protein